MCITYTILGIWDHNVGNSPGSRSHLAGEERDELLGRREGRGAGEAYKALAEELVRGEASARMKKSFRWAVLAEGSLYKGYITPIRGRLEVKNSGIQGFRVSRTELENQCPNVAVSTNRGSLKMN